VTGAAVIGSADVGTTSQWSLERVTASTGLAAAAGWAFDRIAGEPPTVAHPVAWFGRAMRRLERVTYRDSRAAGATHVAVGVGVAVGAGRVAERLLGRWLSTALTTGVCVAGRMLAREATAVVDAVDAGDLDAARARLPTLVGRDTTDLDGDEILRAVVESVAENAVDAVVASIVWAGVFGAPGVLAHRAVNTLDAMVGHRNERYRRFGWAAARLDDAANYLPARLAAVEVALLVPSRWSVIRRAVREDAPRHPSPNGGVIEAAVAAALGVSVGGRNRYGGVDEDRGTLGQGPGPSVADARRAIALTNRLGFLAAATPAAVAILRWSVP